MSKLFIVASALLLFSLEKLGAQTDTVDLVKQLGDEKPKREFVSAAFKSSRVINGHSIEFIGKWVCSMCASFIVLVISTMESARCSASMKPACAWALITVWVRTLPLALAVVP